MVRGKTPEHGDGAGNRKVLRSGLVDDSCDCRDLQLALRISLGLCVS